MFVFSPVGGAQLNAPAPGPSPSLLPPPPLPPTPPASTSKPTTQGWPENHQGPLLVFFDPFSSKVSSLKLDIENKLAASGKSLPTTSSPMQASHIVLDAECSLSSCFRQAGRPDQHVVRLKWIEDSLLHGFSVPEGAYRMDSARSGGGVGGVASGGGGNSRAAAEGTNERGEEERDEASDSGSDYSDSDEDFEDGALSRSSHVETRPPPPRIPMNQRICHNCHTRKSSEWRFMKEKDNALTCGACRGIYYNANKRMHGSGDAALAKRKREAVEGEDDDEDDEGEGEGNAQLSDSSFDFEDEDEDQGKEVAVRNSFSSTKRSRNPAWSTEEKQKLAQLIFGKPSEWPLTKAYETFGERYPERSSTAARQQHQQNRSWYDSAVRRIKRKTKKERRRAQVSTISESNAAVDDDERPQPSTFPSSSSIQTHHQQPLASSSQLPTSQGPPRNSTICQPPQPTPVASSNSHHQHQYQHPHPSTSFRSGPSPQPSRPSAPLEPDSFRMVGVAPSSLPPNTPYCYFCATTETSSFKIISELVAWRELEGGKKSYARVTSRTGCNACYSSHLRRTKVEGVPKEVWQRGEMGRLVWATEQLLIRGMRMRKKVVEGRR
ncbi:hypothetical protein BDY24DRAFT_417302 [Mrakia frigida]|uniref:uncharacterized protein n=1 Tax=Mrakia frigida TaxID=29902 RepID=UPI003FCBFE6E